jgi:ABC-type transport system substrate-binding protein
VGAEEAREKAGKNGRFDYDAPIAGLEIVDRYTLRIRLTQPDLRFLYALAVPNTAAVAREVVEMYGLDFGGHPVGTGPFMLGEYKRSAKIVLVANPNYRHVTYVPQGPVPPEAAPFAAALKGKKLPLVNRVECNVIEEGQAQWLAFLNRELDLLERLPTDFVDEALVDGKAQGEPGGEGNPARDAAASQHALDLLQHGRSRRRRIHAGEDRAAPRDQHGLRRKGGDRLLLKGRAAPAQSPIPPGIAGYDPKLKTQAQLYDPAASRALLDRFGYKDRDGDGFRETPDGKPLALEFWSPPTLAARQQDELLKKNLDAIGIRIGFRKDKLPELRKMARLGKIPMRADGWNADYPDAENYMQLLYGPNAGQENQARFKLPEFDALYDRARKLPDSPERTALFDKMTELVLAYAPWRLTEHRFEDQLLQPWVGPYFPHPIKGQSWVYVDVDMKARLK